MDKLFYELCSIVIKELNTKKTLDEDDIDNITSNPELTESIMNQLVKLEFCTRTGYGPIEKCANTIPNIYHFDNLILQEQESKYQNDIINKANESSIDYNQKSLILT